MNRNATLSNSLLLVLLLGATDTLAAALGTLLMLAAVLGTYAVCKSPLRSRMSGASALLASVLLAATLTGCAEIFMQRWFAQWQQTYSLYAGLIALQCVVLERNGFLRQALADRLKHGSCFAGLMLGFSALRELIGHGSLGRNLSDHWSGLLLISEGLHLATLVPGAFILLGLLLAARQAWTRPNSISKETHRP
ncbi:Rnf-Nqr domain containing protein [Pseudomonas atagonensis]|uniref:Rnf-Nqr domain containing protein n=1 Tax=Pseudomonas atagonensis TaxID=2609964 RepID=UPI001408F34A|nr:Rnf-Nqr domain containing protein [Pseudomonas atagonensis]